MDNMSAGFLPGRFRPQRRNRPPKNRPEAECWGIMESKGYRVTKRGWPDLFCMKDGKMVAVEVKPAKYAHLKSSQVDVMSALASAGIECYKWSPDTGFSRIFPPGQTVHASDVRKPPS